MRALAYDCDKRRWPFISCNESEPTELRYLNSGVFGGTAASLLPMVRWAIAHFDGMKLGQWGDQGVFFNYWVKHPNEITLDYCSLIVSNLFMYRESAHTSYSRSSLDTQVDGAARPPAGAQEQRHWRPNRPRSQGTATALAGEATCLLHGNGPSKGSDALRHQAVMWKVPLGEL